jgi:hypothetical protein
LALKLYKTKNRNSVYLLGAILLVMGLVYLLWPQHFTVDNLGDPLMIGIWIFVLSIVLIRTDPAVDFKIMAVAGLGGFIIEWWGTNTEIWWYFTNERPPFFIIPAWMFVGIAVHRMRDLIIRLVPERLDNHFLYWITFYGFCIWMLWFVRGYIGYRTTWYTMTHMLLIPLFFPRPREDLTLFLCGSLLGVFIEYWGTSRECWTYYSQEIPPAVTVFAHGFAAVSFTHSVKTLDYVAKFVRRTQFSFH